MKKRRGSRERFGCLARSAMGTLLFRKMKSKMNLFKLFVDYK